MLPLKVPSQFGGTLNGGTTVWCIHSCAAIRGPSMLPYEVPLCCHSRSFRAAIRGPSSKPQGIKSRTKIFKFLGFIDPSDQNELYHTPLLSKIWDLIDRKRLWDYPFKYSFACFLLFKCFSVSLISRPPLQLASHSRPLSPCFQLQQMLNKLQNKCKIKSIIPVK